MREAPVAGGKAPDAFRTISEVGEELGLPQHVLRFWETRFPAIRPLKRGGGRRYYRPDDVELLRGIKTLLYDRGYTIKGVQRIIKDGGPRSVGAVGRGEAAEPALPAGAEDGWTREDLDVAGPGPAAVFSQDAAFRLREALDELRECRRVLLALRARDEA